MNRILVCCLIAGFFVGCAESEPKSKPAPETKIEPQSKLTAENYLKIKVGMQQDEVRLILGKPHSPGVYSDDWKEGEFAHMKWVLVTYREGKVTEKSHVNLE